MALHLPAALAKFKHLLSTPKGRKTAAIVGGGGAAVFLGLRAKKKGGLGQPPAGDPAAGLDTGAFDASGGGSTFPTPPDALTFDPGTPGGGQTVSSPDPVASFNPGTSSDFGEQFFQAAAPIPAGSNVMELPSSTTAGPSMLGTSVLTPQLARLVGAGLSGGGSATPAQAAAARTSTLSAVQKVQNAVAAAVGRPAPTVDQAAAQSAAGAVYAARVASFFNPPKPAPPPPPAPSGGASMLTRTGPSDDAAARWYAAASAGLGAGSSRDFSPGPVAAKAATIRAQTAVAKAVAGATAAVNAKKTSTPKFIHW